MIEVMKCKAEINLKGLNKTTWGASSQGPSTASIPSIAQD